MQPEFGFRLRRVTAHGFLVEVPNAYDLAMLFLRAQEYYESEFDDVRGKPFELVQLMHRYVHAKKKKLFDYPKEWAGFNVPGEVIEECLRAMPDPNEYDRLMQRLVDEMKSQSSKFYLIGVITGDQGIYHHELAHVLFSTDEKYQKAMTRLVSRLPVKNLVFKRLQALGYAPKVFVDEAQAYFATWTPGSLSQDDPITSGCTKFCAPFKRVFNRYTRQSPVI